MRVTRTLVRLLLAVLLLGALLSSGAIFAATPSPTNADIRKTRKQVESARRQMDDLAASAEERYEEYESAREQLAETRQHLRISEASLAQAQDDVDVAQAQLQRRVVAIYRGDRLGLMAVLLNATDFRDFASRFELVSRVSASDAALVSRVRLAKTDLEKAHSSLENRRGELTLLVRKANERRTEAEAAVAQQEEFLGRLGAKLKDQIAQERARQERLAAARAKAKREAEERARRAAAEQEAQVPPGGEGSRSAVVNLAASYIGRVPYVWGGTTPAGFDCSGLTQYCYRSIGISIPRTSRSQFRVGTPIAKERVDLLHPGDLVFFGYDGDSSRIHHVGIFAGGDTYIHAPQTGMMVSASSLSGRISDRGDYVGAVRP